MLCVYEEEFLQVLIGEAGDRGCYCSPLEFSRTQSYPSGNHIFQPPLEHPVLLQLAWVCWLGFVPVRRVSTCVHLGRPKEDRECFLCHSLLHSLGGVNLGLDRLPASSKEPLVSPRAL